MFYRAVIATQVDVQNLSYGVHVKGKQKLLLKGVTFHINAGEMCALMVSHLVHSLLVLVLLIASMHTRHVQTSITSKHTHARTHTHRGLMQAQRHHCLLLSSSLSNYLSL
jgi:hypothetical protein